MYLGLDIGTTSICAVVLDGNGNVVYTTTRANNYHQRNQNGERTQDPEKIFSLCKEVYRETIEKFAAKYSRSQRRSGVWRGSSCRGNA